MGVKDVAEQAEEVTKDSDTMSEVNLLGMVQAKICQLEMRSALLQQLKPNTI